MAFGHSNMTLGASVVTLIYTVPSGTQPTQVTIQNLDASTIWIGDSTITTTGATRGHQIAANGEHTRLYYPGDKIYAVSIAGTNPGAIVLLYNTPTGS